MASPYSSLPLAVLAVVWVAAAQQDSPHSLQSAIVSCRSSQRLPKQRDITFILAASISDLHKLPNRVEAHGLAVCGEPNQLHTPLAA